MQKFRIYVEPDPQHCFFFTNTAEPSMFYLIWWNSANFLFFYTELLNFCLFQRHLPAVAVCRLLAQDGQIPAGHPPLKEPLSIFQT